MFMYGLRAEEIKRQYPKRLKVFMDYCGLDGSIKHQAKELFLRAKDNNIWLQRALIKFIEVQKERVKQREILESTIRNYYKAENYFQIVQALQGKLEILIRFHLKNQLKFAYISITYHLITKSYIHGSTNLPSLNLPCLSKIE